MNEILLVLSLLVIYGSVLLVYRLFGKSGLYCFTAIATITANIEVLIMVDAFGMEQTLGNILFASTFLVTDIISEVDGKKAAQKAVNIGIFTSVFFIVVSQSWLLYRPSASDWAQPAIKEIFSNTPRLMIVSVLVYAICQRFDVWAYHKWWAITKKHFNGDSRKSLLLSLRDTAFFMHFSRQINKWCICNTRNDKDHITRQCDTDQSWELIHSPECPKSIQ